MTVGPPRPKSVDRDATFVEGKWLLDSGPSEKGWSRIETITRCPQLAAYLYKLHLPLGINTRPLVRGSLGHIGLAQRYRRILAQERGEDPNIWHTPADAVRILAQRPGGLKGTRDYAKNVGFWLEQVPLILDALKAYDAKYAKERFAVVAVERQLRAMIGATPGHPGWKYTQRADLVMEKADGFVYIFDHKFVGHVSAQTLRDYTLSGQFLGYQVFGRALWKERFGGVWANLVGLEDGKTFTFRRGSPDIAPWAVECHSQAVIDAENDWVRLEAAGRDPWTYPKRLNTQVCRGLYGPCPGQEMCRFGSAALDNVADIVDEDK